MEDALSENGLASTLVLETICVTDDDNTVLNARLAFTATPFLCMLSRDNISLRVDVLLGRRDYGYGLGWDTNFRNRTREIFSGHAS